MNPNPSFELIPTPDLLGRVRALKQQGCRLVQIGANRLPDLVELTYSFDREGQLTNLRLQLPALDPVVPSISSVFGCAVLYENEIHDLFQVRVEGLVLDFQGNLYKTTVKFPFGTVKAPAPKPSAPAGAK